MFVNTDSKYIWKNGSFDSWDDSNIHILTHTFHYGLGVFEGVRAYKTDKGPAIFRLKEHTNRLFDAAMKVDIKIPYSSDELNEAQKNIAKIQTHFVAPWARGYGLAKAMIDEAIKISKENNKQSIQLDIRETQSAAIQLFERKGFVKWGENPSYAFINGNRIKGYYYYKDLK